MIIRRTIGWLALSVFPVPRVVGVAGAVLLLKDVVRLVVQTAKTERRSAVIAFCSMIEHDVENHFDPRPVQGLHHIPKFIHGTLRIPP